MSKSNNCEKISLVKNLYNLTATEIKNYINYKKYYFGYVAPLNLERCEQSRKKCKSL